MEDLLISSGISKFSSGSDWFEISSSTIGTFGVIIAGVLCLETSTVAVVSFSSSALTSFSDS